MRRVFIGCLVLGLVSLQAEPQDLVPDVLRQLEPVRPEPAALEVSIVPVEGQEFSEALEAKTTQRSQWIYSIQVQTPVPVAVKNGDVILAEFSIRTIASTAESGEAKTQFCFEQKGGDFKKSGVYDASTGKSWKKFQVPFQVRGPKGENFGPNEAQICFRLGYRGQTIQIGGVRLLNYGSGYDMSSLPRTRLDYAGRDPNAAWRVEARRRIGELRKAPLTVQVVDSAGKPVAGAKVDVEMKRHAFRFGSAIDLEFFSEQSPDAVRYREYVLAHFNQITPENDLKWSYWEWHKKRRGDAIASLKTLKANGIRVHGHCLIWPGLRVSPADLKPILSDRAALDKRIAEHFNEILEATRGLVDEWDVVNEPYAERDILNLHGDQLVGNWFSLVHRIDPSPVLYLNDYPNFQNNGDDTSHKDDFEKRFKEMLKAGVPVQGIGMQSHFGGMLCPPEAMLKELDRFGKLGLPIQITEFDIDAMDDEAKADFTRDFMIACFSHPAVIGVSTWGFWAGKHYLPSAALVRQDWSQTPWGQVWLDLVKKEWWTRASGVSDASGRYQVDGFLGDYAVKVRQGAKEVTVPVTLDKKTPVLQVKMDLQP